MNGKQSKMLRRIGRRDHKSKKLFKSLPHYTRGTIRTLHKENNERPDLDVLGEVTGNYETSKHVPVP